MRKLADELRNDAPLDPAKPVMVAGDPEKKNAARRKASGIPLRPVDVAAFADISKETGVAFNCQV